MDAQLWSIFNWAKSLKNSPRNIIEGNTKTASNFSHFFFVSQLFLRLRNRNCEYELSTTFCLLLSRCYPWNWHNEIPSGCSASKNMSVNWIWAKNFNRQIKKKKPEELCECNQRSDSAKFIAKSEFPHLLGLLFKKIQHKLSPRSAWSAMQLPIAWTASRTTIRSCNMHIVSGRIGYLR